MDNLLNSMQNLAPKNGRSTTDSETKIDISFKNLEAEETDFTVDGDCDKGKCHNWQNKNFPLVLTYYIYASSVPKRYANIISDENKKNILRKYQMMRKHMSQVLQLCNWSKF